MMEEKRKLYISVWIQRYIFRTMSNITDNYLFEMSIKLTKIRYKLSTLNIQKCLNILTKINVKNIDIHFMDNIITKYDIIAVLNNNNNWDILITNSTVSPLILGITTTILHYSLTPPSTACHQCADLVHQNIIPFFHQCSTELGQGCHSLLAILDGSAQYIPCMFNNVEIWGVGWPFHPWYSSIGKGLLSHPCMVSWCVVIHIDQISLWMALNMRDNPRQQDIVMVGHPCHSLVPDLEV